MYDLNIQTASLADVDSIYSIMHSVSASMKDPSLYVTDDQDFIRRHVEEDGFTLIARSGNTPAGFLIVRIPGNAPDNLGIDLGFTHEQLLLSAHMESAAVLPEFQGNHLQKRLISAAETILVSRGYHSALATVSPKNPYSLQNMLASGYRIAKTTLKYGGLERHIIIKPLSDS